LRKIRFRRQPLQSGLRRKAWLKVPRRRARPRYAPWPPLAVLVGVAGALWFAAEGYPNVNAPTGTSVLKGYGPSVLEGGRSSVAPRSGASATSASGSSRPSGNGSFVLCAGMPQANYVIDGDTIRYGGVKIRLADHRRAGGLQPELSVRGGAWRTRHAAAAGADERRAVPLGRERPGRGPLRSQAAHDRAERPIARRRAGRRGPRPALGRRKALMVLMTTSTASTAR
jgi:hypothetical protein